MLTRQLGNSDLHPTVLTYGTWNISGHPFWTPVSEHDAVETIRRAYDLGVRSFDTAPVYGFGRAEELLAKGLAGIRHDVVLATKAGQRWTGDTLADIRNDLRRESIEQEIEDSLRRLRTDCIDLYQAHWPDPSTPIEESFTTFARLKEQGKIRHVGVSNFTAAMIDEARRYVDVVSLQPRYNLLDRSVERELVPYCVRHGIGILAYSPLASGILTGKYDRNADFSHDWRGAVSDVYRKGAYERHLDVVDRLRPLAREAGASLARLAIAWVLSRPGVTSVILGAANTEQLEHNVAAAELRLDPGLLDAIDRITSTP